MAESKFKKGQTLSHTKGGKYRVMLTPDDGVKLEASWEAAYVYRSLDPDKPAVVVRAAVEMEDGRFQALKDASTVDGDPIYYYEATVFGYTDNAGLLNSGPSVQDMIEDADDGSSVGGTTGLVIVPAAAETLHEDLLAIGNDGDFFDTSL